MTKRDIKVTFSETEKRIDLDLIASAIAKRIGQKGGDKDVKRKKIS